MDFFLIFKFILLSSSLNYSCLLDDCQALWSRKLYDVELQAYFPVLLSTSRSLMRLLSEVASSCQSVWVYTMDAQAFSVPFVPCYVL